MGWRARLAKKGPMQMSFPLHRWEDGGTCLQVLIPSHFRRPRADLKPPTAGHFSLSFSKSQWLYSWALGKSLNEHGPSRVLRGSPHVVCGHFGNELKPHHESHYLSVTNEETGSES